MCAGFSAGVFSQKYFCRDLLMSTSLPARVDVEYMTTPLTDRATVRAAKSGAVSTGGSIFLVKAGLAMLVLFGTARRPAAAAARAAIVLNVLVVKSSS